MLTARRPGTAVVLMNKVPAVTLAFWVIKVLATTVGETAADWLANDVGLGLGGTTWLMSGLLVVALAAQFGTTRYVPAVYWSAVVVISVVGTLVTDILTDDLDVRLGVSTTVFAAALLVTFAAWYRVERTLSIDSIDTTRREAFYWAAVILTFALGTAVGDWLAEALALGYLASLVVFAAAIGVVAIAHFWLGLGPVVSFWIAYVLTRPLGASTGDFLSQPKADGGLGLGTTLTSSVFLAAIVGLVGCLSVQEHGRDHAAAG